MRNKELVLPLPLLLLLLLRRQWEQQQEQLLEAWQHRRQHPMPAVILRTQMIPAKRPDLLPPKDKRIIHWVYPTVQLRLL